MKRESFNSHWFFCKVDALAEQPLSGPVTLPHDAMLLETRDPHTRNGYNTGYFPGGVYRYTKKFFVPQEYQDRHVTFEFEGVYMNSEVTINGRRAGGWPYGYTGFYVDADRGYADAFLNYGEDNQIEVLARNDQEPNSRWYSGSGIYRNVNILVGARLHILPNGVKITTRTVGEQQAEVEVAVTIANLGQETRHIRIATMVGREKGGKTMAAASAKATAPAGPTAAVDSPASIGAGATLTVRQTLTVPCPALWSVEHPNLYTCAVDLLDGEEVIDAERQTFGIRTLELDAQHGLRINGAPVKLRGGCVHHDNGVIGACTLAAAEERRVRIMKASGFNAIRSAHNPLSRAMLDACDRQGMLVMDELSDVWLRGKTKYDYALYFEDWWERDIQAMVDKDYNHPCVVLYSIGNEIRETAFPEGVEYSRKLAEKVRALDGTRFVINSINGWYSLIAFLEPRGKKRRAAENRSTGGFINPLMNLINRFMDLIVALPLVDRGTRAAFATVDVAGYNYMAGRYAMDGKRYPARVICGSESFPPEIAKNWRLVKRLPHVIGDFTWAGWDYLGEAGLCTWLYGKNQSLFKPYPCILAGSALIDITGQRQAQSYIHEIVWGLRKEPYIAVQPVDHSGETPSKSVWRGTNAIDSWSWPGCEGRAALVEVYADAAQVELLLNGRSLGRKPAGDARDFKAVFKTPYQPGELTAVAYDKDGQATGRTTLKTAGPRVQLYIDVETAAPEGAVASSGDAALTADGADLAFLTIRLADEAGILHPLADREVTVRVEGAGALLGFGSANPLTEERFTDEVHTTYQGRALAVVRAGAEPGTVRVTVSAEVCEEQVVEIRVERAQ
jgi:beta-galactosidase